jgi:hypothetical protein
MPPVIAHETMTLFDALAMIFNCGLTTRVNQYSHQERRFRATIRPGMICAPLNHRVEGLQVDLFVVENQRDPAR